MLKMKIIRVLGAYSRRKTLASHELGKNLFKKKVGETSCRDRVMFLLEMDVMLIE